MHCLGRPSQREQRKIETEFWCWEARVNSDVDRVDPYRKIQWGDFWHSKLESTRRGSGRPVQEKSVSQDLRSTWTSQPEEFEQKLKSTRWYFEWVKVKAIASNDSFLKDFKRLILNGKLYKQAHTFRKTTFDNSYIFHTTLKEKSICASFNEKRSEGFYTWSNRKKLQRVCF